MDPSGRSADPGHFKTVWNQQTGKNIRNKSAAVAPADCIPAEVRNGLRPEDPAPWRRQPFYPPHVLGLHQEIIDFYEYIKPIPEEEYMRNQVVHRIRAVVYRLWPEARLEIFGSFATKLYLPTSDIDLMIMGKWDVSPLYTLKTELVTADIADEENVTVLDKASVPIVKVVDKETSIRVDISFNTCNGVNSANLIRVSVMCCADRVPVLSRCPASFLCSCPHRST
jgi:predicted nucleotidyltransferase